MIWNQDRPQGRPVADHVEGPAQLGERQARRDEALDRDPARHEAVLLRLLGEARKLGFGRRGLMKSSTPGQKGNREFFVWWELAPDAGSPSEDAERVREVVYEKEN